MLTRYGEERRRGVANDAAVKIALSRAGRVIFVSGVTLGLTNAGLTFCSVDVVASIGWGGALSCFVAVSVHLSLLPALMVICGPYLQQCTCSRACGQEVALCNGCGNTTVESSASLLSVQTPTTRDSKVVDKSSFTQMTEDAGVSLKWVRLGEFCRDHRNAIITGMFVLMVPFTYCTLQYQTSISGLMLTPRETPALITMENITGACMECVTAKQTQK